MPVMIPKDLPAFASLSAEQRAIPETDGHPSERIWRVGILNLMPTKVATETQLLRLLGHSPLRVKPILLRTGTYQSRHIGEEHLKRFYSTLGDCCDESLDGMIITGAPVEHLEFENVEYWKELQKILDFSRRNVPANLYICWGAQAALYHQFGIRKYPLDRKMFGIFRHTIHRTDCALFRGFDDEYCAPHSRHTEIRRTDIEAIPELEILSESEEAGIYIVGTRDERQFFITGHSEYDPLTLHGEFERDRAKGLPIQIPENYYPNNDPEQPPIVRWRGHAHLLFLNWLHAYVAKQ